MKDELLAILECSEINNRTLSTLLDSLEIENTSIQSEENEIVLYKSLESLLLEYYKNTLGIDISKKIYSKEEILGLLTFLYIKKFKKQTSEGVEAFFDTLFFSKTNEDVVKALKEENRLLREEIERIQEKRVELDCTVDYSNVDYEVLKKLEKENVDLKNTIKFENDEILRAWYNLCEEYVKNHLVE